MVGNYMRKYGIRFQKLSYWGFQKRPEILASSKFYVLILIFFGHYWLYSCQFDPCGLFQTQKTREPWKGCHQINKNLAAGLCSLYCTFNGISDSHCHACKDHKFGLLVCWPHSLIHLSKKGALFFMYLLFPLFCASEGSKCVWKESNISFEENEKLCSFISVEKPQSRCPVLEYLRGC